MRFKKIQTSGQALISLLTNPDHAYQCVDNSLPKDTRIIDIVHDSLRNCYWMVVESDSFPDVPEGMEAVTLKSPVIKGYEVKKLDHFEGIIC